MAEVIRILTTYQAAGQWAGGLLLGLALVGLAWLALRRLVVRWRHQFTARLDEVQVMLKRNGETVERVFAASQSYAPDDPEPYGQLARDLQQTLSRAHSVQQHLAVQLRSLGQDTLNQPSGRLARFWFTFWPEPRYWWQHCQALDRLRQATTESQAQANQAETLLHTLQALPQQVARRCRDLYPVSDEIGHIVQALYTSGVRGSRLDSAADEAKDLEGRLKSLPLYFFQDPAGVAAGAGDKASTILAWQTLAQIETPLRQGLAQFQQWQAEYQECGRRLQAMQQAVETARQRLEQVPAEIDATSYVTELGQAAIEAEELAARYHSPSLEILAELSERILGVTEVSTWLIAQCDSLAEKSSRLQALALAGTDLLAQVETALTQTTQAELYPLAWTDGQIELERLRKLQADLGVTGQRRTPAELEQHMTIAVQLAGQAQVLKNTVAETKAYRDRLVPLLQRPELEPEPAWLQRAETLHEQARLYDPKNWPDGDAVTRLRESVRQLAGRHEALIPPQASHALPAEQLGLYLSEVEELLVEIETFQARLQRVEDTLVSLQQIEADAREKLTVTVRALELLLKHWPGSHLSAKPVASYQARLNKLRQEGHKLLATLDKSKSGQVKEKERRIAAWIKSCTANLQAFQAEMLVELKNLAGQLDGELKALQEIALLDRERAVRDARQLLQTQALPQDILLAGGASQHQVELLVEQISAMFDRAEIYHRSLAALTSQIKDRIQAPQHRLAELRQKALAAVEAIRQAVAPGTWPPVDYDLKPLMNQLDQVDSELVRLKQSARTTGDVLSYLETNIKRCENVLSKANRDLAQLRAEQSRGQVILEQVDQWQRKLELYRARHYEDTAVVQAVNQRLNLMAEKRAAARRPQLSPRQVEQILADLQTVTFQNLQVNRDGKTETIPVNQID